MWILLFKKDSWTFRGATDFKTLRHKSIDIMCFSDHINYVFYNVIRKTQHILYVQFVLCISYIVCKYAIVLLANSLDGE